MTVKAFKQTVFKMCIPLLPLNSFIRNYKFRKAARLCPHFNNPVTPAEDTTQNSVAVFKVCGTADLTKRPGSKCNFLRHRILNRTQRQSSIVFIIKNIWKNVTLAVKSKGVHCKIHWKGLSLTFYNLTFRHNANAIRWHFCIYKRHAAVTDYDITFFHLFTAWLKAEPAAGKNSSLCNKLIIYKRKNIFWNVKNFWSFCLRNFYTMCFKIFIKIVRCKNIKLIC